MPRMIVTPDKLDLQSPGRRDYWVAIEHDSIWGDHLMPLTVLVGPEAKEGQGLVAFGSNHGNEYEGPIAIKHLLREMKLEDVRGRIILVPVLNVAAFRTGTRDSMGDDGVNLNRAFVSGAGEQPAIARITHRIAAFVRKHIWPSVHVVLDLHAGGEVARFALCASHHEVDDPQQQKALTETARWFGTPFVMMYQNLTPGLMVSEAERLGKITIGTELGWGCAVNLTGVRYGKQGILAAAINHGQLRGQIQPIGHHADGTQRVVKMVERRCFSVAPFAGHYEPVVELGAPVRTGQTIGLLHDFQRIDESPFAVNAELDGIVMVHAWHAPVRQGQHIAVVARPAE